MDLEIQQRLEALRSDYQKRVGSPFLHFYCPILFRDEDSPLCKGHIVNGAFPDSARKWVVQRADIDSFYGSAFESDFVSIQYRGKQLADNILANPYLSKQLQPQIRVGDEDVEHFVARGPVPGHFTETAIEGPSGPIRFGLKIHPDDSIGKKWTIAIEKDLRLPALVSVVKAAYLTMFEMLGYSYPLSAGGHLVGWEILGKFYVRNRGLGRSDIIANGQTHFKEFANMVRPVLHPPDDIRGTASDRFVFVCRCDSDTPWGMIVFVRTGHLLHAALVPMLETASAAERFVTFLKGGGCKIRANRCRFDSDKWYGSKEEEVLTWPEADLLAQVDFRTA